MKVAYVKKNIGTFDISMTTLLFVLFCGELGVAFLSPIIVKSWRRADVIFSCKLNYSLELVLDDQQRIIKTILIHIWVVGEVTVYLCWEESGRQEES